MDSGAWTRVLAERPLSGSQHGQSAGRVSAGTRQGPGYLNRGRESSRREQGLGRFPLRCRTTPSWTTLVMSYISRKGSFSRRELFKKHQSFPTLVYKSFQRMKSIFRKMFVDSFPRYISSLQKTAFELRSLCWQRASDEHLEIAQDVRDAAGVPKETSSRSVSASLNRSGPRRPQPAPELP